MPGTATLEVEVTNISANGIWLLLGDEELAISYSEFPWFRNATVAQITDVQRPSADHVYWPQLDIDLSVQSIREPRAFPLIARNDA